MDTEKDKEKVTERTFSGSPEKSWREFTVISNVEFQDKFLIDGLLKTLKYKNSNWKEKYSGHLFFLREKRKLRLFIHVDVYDSLVGELANILEILAIEENETISKSTSRDTINELKGPYSGRCALELFTSLFSRASCFVLELLEGQRVSKKSTLAIALDMMIVHLPVVDFIKRFQDQYPSILSECQYPVSFAVYKSHVDGFIIMSTNPKDTRIRLENHYDRNKTDIHARVNILLNQYSTLSLSSEPAKSWLEIADFFFLQANTMLHNSEIEVTWDSGYLGDNNDIDSSAFHQIIQENVEFRESLQQDTAYQAMRFMMSGLYMTLTSLGINVMERIFLCYSIYRSIEELHGVDSVEMLRTLSNHFQFNPSQ